MIEIGPYFSTAHAEFDFSFGTTYYITGSRVKVRRNDLDSKNYQKVTETWNTSTNYDEFNFDFESLKKFIRKSEGETSYTHYYLNTGGKNIRLISILLGLTNQYIARVMYDKKFPSGEEITKGLNSLDWKMDIKIEVQNNYVTNQPQFKYDGKRLSFEEVLLLLISIDESQIDGV